MSWFNKNTNIALTLVLLFSSGCSFTPLYSSYGNNVNKTELKDIYIPPADNRMDQIIRNELIEFIQGDVSNTNSRLHLNFQTIFDKKDLLLSSKGKATHSQITITVDYQIFEVGEFKEVLYSNKIIVIDSFANWQSEFNNSRSEIKTNNIIAKEIAKKISNQINLHFIK